MSGATDARQRVLDEIQSGFPIEHDPYGALARQLGLSRADVLGAAASLRADGTIRRIGASFSSRHLGYASTLCALAVPGDSGEVDRVASLVSSHMEVTHNYLRDAEYNVWFTVIAPSPGEVERVLGEIRSETGCDDVLSLPATKLYKVRVDFSERSFEDVRLRSGGRGHMHPKGTLSRPSVARALKQSSLRFARCGTARETPPPAPQAALSFNTSDPFDVALVRAVQGDVGEGEFPFSELRVDEGRALARLGEWKADGTVRRFGAFVRHREMGFAFNGMTVWNVPDGDVDFVGEALARLPFVSHCYARPRAATWPYNLYGMVHAKTRDELDARVTEMRDLIGLDCRVLVSSKEYKKSSPVYFPKRDAYRVNVTPGQEFVSLDTLLTCDDIDPVSVTQSRGGA